MASNRSRAGTVRPRSRAAFRIACANGCSEPVSRPAAKRRTVVSSKPGRAFTVLTVGRPMVTVPVLSRTTVVSCPARCKASPSRIRMPCSAALPTPTMIEIGVASPSAQGQAMISTVKVVTSTKPARGSGPKLNQARAVSTATISTDGTNTAATRSANRPSGGLLFCACRTLAMIWASTVSSPTRVAWNTKVPDWFTVPPVTGSPSRLTTGRGSPVSMDSSTVDWPPMSRPSTGIFSPGRTRIRAPRSSVSMGTSRSPPSSTKRAVFGRKPSRR